ncbi:ubiquinol-cytochrome-c reductase cytochrome c1 [Fusarium heterosporum]|uniref:Ubiquinol-cytochrome-c reductase cytochrome c1 n=1 Tax=Fusarium heterosporum TaxID=42747 RepID=A0A8H5TUX2_FUSHE|nr:ubiquinol-cytochrome-c reductase cytochrome c1 [Fusarium heterosporum]
MADKYTTGSSSGSDSGSSFVTGYRQRMGEFGILKGLRPTQSKPSFQRGRSPPKGDSQKRTFTHKKLEWNDFFKLYTQLRNRYPRSSSRSSSRSSARSSSVSPSVSSCEVSSRPCSRPSSLSPISPSVSSFGSSCRSPSLSPSVYSYPSSTDDDMSTTSTSTSRSVFSPSSNRIPLWMANQTQKNINNHVLEHQAYPSLRSQNLLLSRMQTILEYACFQFAQKHMPSILQTSGWTCPEAGELSKWTYYFYKNQHYLQLDRLCRSRKSQYFLSAMLNSVKEIRHDAVHRNPLDTNYLSLQMSHAIAFCAVLDVPDALVKLQAIQICAETQILKLGIVTPANVKLGEAPAQAGQEGQGIFESRRQDACKTLEKLLLDPSIVAFGEEETAVIRQVPILTVMEVTPVIEGMPTLQQAPISTVVDVKPTVEMTPKEKPEHKPELSRLFLVVLLAGVCQHLLGHWLGLLAAIYALNCWKKLF